jgi:methyl-accepting chemotaxis protein
LLEGTQNTHYRLLVALTAGALASSSAAMAGMILPLSMIGAIAFSGFGMVLALRYALLRKGSCKEHGDLKAADLARSCYEGAVRATYSRRRSAAALRHVLEMTETLLGMCARLRSTVGQIKHAPVGSPAGFGTASSSGDEGPGGVSRETSGRSIEPMLQEVMASVREMAVVLRDMDHNAKELITSTEETAYSMSRLDSFLQDMANRGRDLETSTDAANRVALEGTKVVEEMGRENEAIISTVNEAASAVEDLGRWSQEVGKIVEVIRDIADETNLLALNASIIAAQSGEHGKAFGVVAEEIRGLAERTSSSTKEISDLVKAVQKNVANVVNGMKKSLQRVERGELLTRNAGMVLEKVFESFESSRSLAKQIASSTFEHKIDSSQVVRSLHKVTDIARRLQSHNDAGWTEAGETLGMARALNAMNGWREGMQDRASARDGAWGTHSGSEGAETCIARNGDVRRLLVTLDSEIGSWIDSLKQAGDTLRSRLWDLEQTAELAPPGVLEASKNIGASDLGMCWDIVDCDVGLRDRCPAYSAGKASVFFTGDAACVGGEKEWEGGGGHEASECGAGKIDPVVHKVGMGK